MCTYRHACSRRPVVCTKRICICSLVAVFWFIHTCAQGRTGGRPPLEPFVPLSRKIGLQPPEGMTPPSWTPKGFQGETTPFLKIFANSAAQIGAHYREIGSATLALELYLVHMCGFICKERLLRGCCQNTTFLLMSDV